MGKKEPTAKMTPAKMLDLQDKLQSLLGNLASGSIGFCPEGGALVRIPTKYVKRVNEVLEGAEVD